MGEFIQFVVSANGPYGVFWLSKLSEIGLRTLVTRDQADVFPTIEDAQRAITTMPQGYKLAKISFAIELAGELRAARAPQSAQLARPMSHEPKNTIGEVHNLQSGEPETISGAECGTVGDEPAGGLKAWRKWFSRAALARLWQR
jgi:hypothetical protein